MQIVISWVSFYYDFDDTKLVNSDGPSVALHNTFFDPEIHQKHLILNPTAADPRGEHLQNWLHRHYPTRDIGLESFDINVFNYRELKQACENLLEKLTNQGFNQFDILYSNGTTPMRTVWVLLKLEGRFRIRLIQGKDRLMHDPAKDEAPFVEILLDKSVFPHRLQAIEAAPKPKELCFPDTLTRIYALATRAAIHEELPVLIRGESGTGKEFLARHVHDHSSRRGKKFIAVNIASISDTLLESRLFGYVKGAFTGADQDTDGFFQQANGGTLFLDEIGDISQAMQVALLRVIQQQEITPVGSTLSLKINVRIIAATHQPLEERCASGRFRWDLYYRLSVATLDLPPLREYPLRERRQFLEHHLRRVRGQFQTSLRLDQAVADWFDAYDFPGNHRQMYNLLVHFAVFCDNTASLADLVRAIRGPAEEADYSLAAAERKHILQVWQQCGQNLSLTAKTLEISLNTLKAKLRSYQGLIG